MEMFIMGFMCAVMLISFVISLHLSFNMSFQHHSSPVKIVTRTVREVEVCDCDTGYDCIEGQCKLQCGAGSLNVAGCPEDHRCIGEVPQWNIPGHCERNNCGGSENKQCPGGYWCNRFGDAPDVMGVCVNEVCPAGCATWFDGCNICSCNGNGGAVSCSYKFCETLNPPYCVQEFEPTPTCESAIAKNDEMQLGSLHDLLSMFNRLDLKYKKLFLEIVQDKTI